MSPQSLRRFRAERLLAQQFEALRAQVLAAVRRSLAAGGLELDVVDLEACYAQAWQGLHAAVLDGQEIANPAGWLVVVTQRRTIEELRSCHRAVRAESAQVEERGCDPDLAARIDDLSKLRHLFEAMRARLNWRECEAASLCYLQGLSRAEAAVRMGVSERRMRKLMDGDGAGGEGVACKVGRLLAVVSAGRWCDEQASLMRALAFGLLDPAGERYRLATQHQRECAACRRYVISLRGLAAVLPPLVVPPGIFAGAAGAGAGVGGGAGAGAGGGTTAGGGIAAAGAGSGAWGAAGGSLGAKLAGTLAALGVAAGGATLLHAPVHPLARGRQNGTAIAAGFGGGAAGAGGAVSELGGAAERAAAAIEMGTGPSPPGIASGSERLLALAPHAAGGGSAAGGGQPSGGAGTSAEFGIEPESPAVARTQSATQSAATVRPPQPQAAGAGTPIMPASTETPGSARAPTGERDATTTGTAHAGAAPGSAGQGSAGQGSGAQGSEFSFE
jgi:DNA-directed RNA polymerase specialized sigma24 family protein